MQHTKNQVLFKRAQDLLFNPTASLFLSEKKFLSCVASCLANAPNRNEFRKVVEKLLKQPRFRRLHNAFPADKNKFSILPTFSEGISSERLFDFAVTLFRHEASLINSFVIERDKFEDAFLRMNYAAAEEILNSVAESHGISLWLIRSRTILLAYQGRDDEILLYCAKEKDGLDHELIKTLIDYFQLFSTSDLDNCLRLHNSLLLKRVIEYREAKVHHIASVLSTMFSPQFYETSGNPVDFISIIQAFPLVDQYVLFSMIIQQLVVDEVCLGIGSEIDSHNLIKALRNAVIDPQLSRTNNILTQSLVSDTSAIGQSLLQEYEIGDYQKTIVLFENNYMQLTNCIPFVNLIAKAYAYESQLPENIPKGVLLDLLLKLIPIYTLGADHVRAEEHLWSLIVRLRGLTQSVNIHMAILLAMPHRCQIYDVKRASAMSLIVSTECTPIIEKLFSGSNGLLLGKNSTTLSATPPKYRQVKYALCSAVNEGRPTDEIDALFEEFRKSTPLLKDYLELYSEYCVYTSQFHRLLKVAAEALVKNPNIYACIPMDYLSREIEKQFCTTLHAVIVVFYYSRKVSKDITWLLNEIFEEYVLTKGAERPSQLLAEKDALDELDAMFYREICIPDVMDCLTCFDNINDLRAERIRILDLLLKLNAIENTERTQEVDELVGKVLLMPQRLA